MKVDFQGHLRYLPQRNLRKDKKSAYTYPNTLILSREASPVADGDGEVEDVLALMLAWLLTAVGALSIIGFFT